MVKFYKSLLILLLLSAVIFAGCDLFSLGDQDWDPSRVATANDVQTIWETADGKGAYVVFTLTPAEGDPVVGVVKVDGEGGGITSPKFEIRFFEPFDLGRVKSIEMPGADIPGWFGGTLSFDGVGSGITGDSLDLGSGSVEKITFEGNQINVWGSQEITEINLNFWD